MKIMEMKTGDLVGKLDDGTKTAFVANRTLQQKLAKGNKTERETLLRELTEELLAQVEVKDSRNRVSKEPKHNAKIRRDVCRLIGPFGTDAQVPALKQMLEEENVRESARAALEQIPGKLSTDALIDAALNSVGDIFRIGVIAALANRTGKEVADALRTCMNDPANDVALVAAESLAQQPDVGNDRVLVGMTERFTKQKDVSRRVRFQLERCRVYLAETLKRAGQRDAGNRIYMSIQKTCGDNTIKKAAKIGMGGLRRVEK